MGVNRGGLLASVATATIGGLEGFGGFVAPGICSIDDGAGDAGGGAGAASSGGADDDFFGGSAGGTDPNAGADPNAGTDPNAGADPNAGTDPNADKGGGLAEWMKSFSGEKTGDELSNQEWLSKIGVKDLDGLAKMARDNQRALRESGRVKVPGDGASEADVKAYREAVGAPENVEGYKVELPAAAEGYEIDAAFMDPMKAIADKYHIPAAAFKEFGDAFMASQLASLQGEVARNNTDRDATLKAWGPQAEQGKEEFRRGLQALDLTTADVRKIQTGLGAGATMELFRKIGQMAGEDFFAGNGSASARQFGVGDLASAQKALDTMTADKDTVAKIRAKDPVTVARYNGIIEVISQFKQRAASAR